MQRPIKRTAQDEISLRAEYPSAFPHHDMGIGEVLDHLGCKYEVHGSISDREAQRVAHKIGRGVDKSMIHAPILSSGKQIAVRLMSTSDIEYLRAVTTDVLQRRLCRPFKIRPKVFIMEIVLLPKSKRTPSEAASSGSFYVGGLRGMIVDLLPHFLYVLLRYLFATSLRQGWHVDWRGTIADTAAKMRTSIS
jgi:hypothetical protein